MSRRRSGTPGGASIDDNYLASMIFDTPSKQGGGGGTSLQKSSHHKSTSALSDVQTANPPASSTMGKRGSTSSAPFGAPSHVGSSSTGGMHQGRAHTLAVTESSYLSSIGSAGGYADEFEDASPPSSGFSSANTSFTSNYSSSHYNTHGHSGYSTGGGGGNLRNFDLADEFLQHLSTGGSGGGSHSTSPTGYSTPRKADNIGGSNTVHPRVDIPASSSPVTRYKRTTSPTIAFPTENHQQFIVTHGEKGTSRHGHVAAHPQDMKRSRSPDQYKSTNYSSSYHPPSMMEQGNFFKHHHQHHQPQHQHGQQGPYMQQSNMLHQQGNMLHQQGNLHGGGTSPTMHVHGHMSSSSGHDHHRGGGGHWIEDRKSPTQQSRYSGGGSPHGIKTIPNSQSRTNPSGHGSVPSGTDSIPYHGIRKPSDQEIGILEALSMVDKRVSSKLDDGTLV